MMYFMSNFWYVCFEHVLDALICFKLFNTWLEMTFSLASLGLFHVAKLIGCDIDGLKLTLSLRKMKVGNDNIVQKLTLSQVK